MSESATVEDADRHPRAAAMPADERRAAIIAATLPLLLEGGPNVTTRQIAEAAGIAEGTIFRVFPDKETLLQAVLDQAFDTAPSERALRAINPDLPFEEKLAEAVKIIQRRTLDLWRLISAVGDTLAFRNRPRKSPPDLPALAELFAAERRRIRVDPDRASRQLLGLTLAVTHPALTGDPTMSGPEIVSLLLDGIRCRTRTPKGTTC